MILNLSKCLSFDYSAVFGFNMIVEVQIAFFATVFEGKLHDYLGKRAN